ncbi:putative D-aminoacylase [Hypomontagnella monticulosa]|nr:putative D-aminoacylase [Hypomontagnella monticulosa]
MSDLPTRLDRLSPKIEKLMSIGGTAGLSLGVVRDGRPIYHRSYGSQDIENGVSTNEDTVFPTGSLTKALTAASIAILIDEGKATWETLVKDALPTFHPKDEILRNNLTLTDILCHRHGMSWGDHLFIGTDSNILIDGQHAMDYINSQVLLLPFRAQWTYNNIAFDIAGKVIESLSGESFTDFVMSRIFKPLGMERSFLLTPPADTKNVSKCYNALDDHTPARIKNPTPGDNGYLGPTAGMRSCVSDLMKLYTAWVTSFNDQFNSKRTATEGSPFKQVAQLMSTKIPMDQPSRNEISYALGWGRVQLPGRMGQIGLNPRLLPGGMPIIGNQVPPELVIFHQGSMPGTLAAVILLPSTNSSIVVLSNTLALTDVADWVGQLVLEEVLDVPFEARADMVGLAKITIVENLKWYPDIINQLERERKNGTSPKELDQYVGVYWDDIHVFKIVVTLEKGSLYWALQGLENEKFQLKHYEDDTFTWLQPRNELSRRGRWVVGGDQITSFWKVEFKTNDAGLIDRLHWEHDAGNPQVEYRKS